MKKLMSILATLLISTLSFAQSNAITDLDVAGFKLGQSKRDVDSLVSREGMRAYECDGMTLLADTMDVFGTLFKFGTLSYTEEWQIRTIILQYKLEEETQKELDLESSFQLQMQYLKTIDALADTLGFAPAYTEGFMGEGGKVKQTNLLMQTEVNQNAMLEALNDPNFYSDAFWEIKKDGARDIVLVVLINKNFKVLIAHFD